MLLTGTTTDNTQTALVDAPIVRVNWTYGFTATIVARIANGSGSAMFIRQGIIHNDSGTALVGSIQTIGTDINASVGVLR